MPLPPSPPHFVIGSAPPSPVISPYERRRSSEEYAARMQLHAFSEINQMLAKRNLQIEADLRAKAEAAKAAKSAPSRPIFKSALSAPGSVYPMGLRPTGQGLFDSMEDIPLNGLSRRRSTPGVLPMPPALISPTSSATTPRGGRTPRHYFDLTPGGGRQPTTPRGDYFTPMQAPATVVEPEPIRMRDRCALVTMVLGMGALATPIIVLVVKAIQRNIEAVTSKGGQ